MRDCSQRSDVAFHRLVAVRSCIVVFFLVALPGVVFSCSSDEPFFDVNDDFTLSSLDTDGNKTILFIPADSFKESMRVEIHADAPDVQFNPQAFVANTEMEPLTKPVVLRFSKPQVTADEKQMLLKIPIDDEMIERARAENKNIYAMLKGEGFFVSPFREQLAQWQLGLGFFIKEAHEDDSRIYFVLPLIATAEQITVLTVLGPKAKVFGLDQIEKGADKNLAEQYPFERPWVVICLYRDDDTNSCLYDADTATPGQLLHESLNENSEWLLKKNWSKAKYFTMDTVALQGLESDDVSFVYMNQYPQGTRVNVAHLSEERLVFEDGSAASGLYHVVLGGIVITVQAVLDSVESEFDAVLHEMFHGVQFAELENVFTHTGNSNQRDHLEWLFEGTATAMEFWKNADGDRSRFLNTRHYGRWRSWQNRLNDSDNLVPYEAWEFFALLGDGDLSYLPALFRQMGGFNPAQHSYDTLNSALWNLPDVIHTILQSSREHESLHYNSLPVGDMAYDEPLRTAYVNAVSRRTPYMGYPHCEAVETVNAPANSDGFEKTLSIHTSPFSTACLGVQSLNHEENHGQSCIRVELAERGSRFEREFMIIVDGPPVTSVNRRRTRMAYGGTPLFVHDHFFYLSVLDLGFDRFTETEIDMKIRIAGECDVDADEVGSGEVIQECLPLRNRCVLSNRQIVCYLEMKLSCWAPIIKCDATGCYENSGDGRFERPITSFGLCSEEIFEISEEFDMESGNVDESIGSRLPSHRQCGGINLCRRIILCG